MGRKDLIMPNRLFQEVVLCTDIGILIFLTVWNNYDKSCHSFISYSGVLIQLVTGETQMVTDRSYIYN